MNLFSYLLLAYFIVGIGGSFIFYQRKKNFKQWRDTMAYYYLGYLFLLAIGFMIAGVIKALLQ